MQHQLATTKELARSRNNSFQLPHVIGGRSSRNAMKDLTSASGGQGESDLSETICASINIVDAIC